MKCCTRKGDDMISDATIPLNQPFGGSFPEYKAFHEYSGVDEA